MKTEIKALIDAMSKRFTSHPWHGIELGEKSPAIVNAFIEIIPSDSHALFVWFYSSNLL
jgi:inorganic pyrophosphatase